MKFFTVKTFRIWTISTIWPVMLLFCFAPGFAQTTVNYSMSNTGYYNTATTGSSGIYTDGSQLGMYSNGGGVKNVVAYREFRTAGNNTDSFRTLQVGDIFTLTVSATSAFGHIGFSLNTVSIPGSYANRNANSRLYIQEDGTSGSWYVNSSAGNQTLDYNVSTVRRDYVFKVYITSETTCDVELTVDGTTKRLFNLTMNGSAGTNITGFSLYMSDDYNGSFNSNVFWKQVTEVRANTSVDLGYYLTTGTFTPGRIKDGLAANSTDTESVNSLNIGGDFDTKVVLNQANTYSGPTVINPDAHAELQHPGAFGATSGVTISEFGKLSLYTPGSMTLNPYSLAINGYFGLNSVGGSITWPGNISVPTSSIITAGSNPGSLTISGMVSIPTNRTLTIDGTQPILITNQISGGGKIVKEGTNVLTLSENNSTLSGGININRGTVSVTAVSFPLGSGVITFPQIGGFMGALAGADGSFITNPISVFSDSAIIKTSGTMNCSGAISGSGTLTKSGVGELELQSANSFSGGLNLAEGSVRPFFSTSLGSGLIRLGYDYSGEVGNSVLLKTGSSPLNNAITVGANISGASRTITTDSGVIAMNGLVTLNGNLNLEGEGSFDFYGKISGSGGINISSSVELRNFNNNYSGNTTINSGGSLRLGNSNVVPDFSTLVLNGGLFETANLSDQMSQLVVQSNSTIELGFTDHVLTFAPSAEEIWNGTLTIQGWTGTAGQSNVGGGRIMVGFEGLNPEQLDQIVFEGYPGRAILLPSGEVVPAGPPNFVFTSGEEYHGEICVNTSGTITYAISNLGGDASGITISSNSVNFVVSNLSSTSIASNAAITFDVTFTPSMPGTVNGAVTVNTTTPGSNAPIVINQSGTGLANFTYYADADGDTYGNPAISQTVCTGVPAGYSVNNTDCNDGDANKFQSGTLYVDGDFDGYSTNATSVVCYGASVPAGYVAAATAFDCNDAVAAINPGHTEVLYNGVDDNCDGNLDEGNQLLSNVITQQCGITLAAINSVIQVTTYPNITQYRYRVYKIVSGNPVGAPQFVERAQPYFTLTQMSTYEYAATYSIQVELQRNGTWLGYYGSACQVSTPALLDNPNGSGSINPSLCGQTLATISTLIATPSLQSATAYKFRVTNITDPLAPGQVQEIERSQNYFALTMLPYYFYGTTYNVEVSVKASGVFSGYGATCPVTSPSVPMINNCDQHMAQPVNYISTASLNKVVSYRFEISLVDANDNPATTFTLDRTLPYFSFNMVPNYVQGGKYMVRVALRTTGYHSPFGEACFVYAPVSLRQDGSQKPEILTSRFDATVFPNPYVESFSLDFDSTSEDKVQLRVYDMIGKLLEERTFETTQIELAQFGQKYPSGVYNIVLTQGGNVKTLRVIKR